MRDLCPQQAWDRSGAEACLGLLMAVPASGSQASSCRLVSPCRQVRYKLLHSRGALHSLDLDRQQLRSRTDQQHVLAAPPCAAGLVPCTTPFQLDLILQSGGVERVRPKLRADKLGKRTRGAPHDRFRAGTRRRLHYRNWTEEASPGDPALPSASRSVEENGGEAPRRLHLPCRALRALA